MAVADDNNLATAFEDGILSELEITIMPYKLGKKIRMEIMNPDFSEFAVKRGVIDSDFIEEITWKQAGALLERLINIAPQFYRSKA
jgi:hypothetical protein